MGSNDSNSEDDVESLDFVQARNVIATEAALESTVRRETSTFDLFRLDLSLYTIQTIGCGPPTTPLGEKEERPIWQQGYVNHHYDFDHDQDCNHNDHGENHNKGEI